MKWLKKKLGRYWNWLYGPALLAFHWQFINSTLLVDDNGSGLLLIYTPFILLFAIIEKDAADMEEELSDLKAKYEINK